MYNPYDTVNFGTVNYVHGVSHYHAETVTNFTRLHNNGIQHIGISNYYPSKPCYPLADVYEPYPGMIECPNAEHHNFANLFGVGGRLHLNGLGSLRESGSPRGETPVGFDGEPWQDAVTSILNSLLYSDAGGVTINHPQWTGLKAKDCCEILDHDNRVLGIEIFNQSTEESGGNGWDVDTWDEILTTGRKCFGFCVPDHSSEVIRGRNIILTTDKSVYDCLLAYRIGRFFGKAGLTDFKFTNIQYTDGYFSVSTDRTARIKIVTDQGETITTGTSATKQAGRNDYIYIRAEAYSEEDDDTIFTNPIFLDKPGKPLKDKGRIFAVEHAMFFD